MSFAWNRIQPLLEGALAQPPDERRAWLELECSGEAGLAEAVWNHLVSGTREDGFLESPWDEDEDEGEGASVPSRIDGYVLLRRIGTGGMGSVWLAERADGHYRQRVAIKLVKRGMDTEAVVRRFRLERQVLADLEHPYIARLLDGGATPEGLPYLVMEHVEGTPLLSYCETQRLELKERLELFRRVCEALGFAHEQGVVHCDLKPSNVFVDSGGHPKLLDFGIAKVLKPGDEVDLTRTGDRFLSPRYASPEQIRGQPVDRTSDVYGLGVVLYELLSGVHPHGQLTTTWRMFEDEVLEREPTAPSKAVLLSPPPPPPEGRTDRSRALRGDLDTITLTALRKEPERRYASASAIGTDIGRYLAGEPVRARPDTWWYRTSKLLRRHRALASATLAFIGLLSSALVVTWSLYRISERSRDRAGWEAYTSALTAAESALRDGSVGEAHAALDRIPETRRGWIWHHLASRTDRALRVVPVKWRSPLALDDDLGRLALDTGSELRILDTETLEPLWRFEVDPKWSNCKALAMSPGGRWLAADFAGLEEPRLFDLRNGDLLVISNDCGGNNEVAFHPRDGRLFFTCGDTLRVMDPDVTRELTRWSPHSGGITALAFSPSGSRLATASFGEASAAVWDTETYRLVSRMRGHTMALYSVDFSPSGERLATGSLDGTLRIWDAETGALEEIQDLQRGNVEARFLADDDKVLVSTMSGGMLVRDLTTRSTVSEWLGNRDQAFLAVDRVRGRLYSCDGTGLREWDFQTRDVRVLPAGEWADAVTFHRNGAQVVNVGPDGHIRRWSLPDCDAADMFGSGELRLVDVSSHPREDEVVTIDHSGRSERWDLKFGKRLATGGPALSPPRTCEIRHDPPGRRLLRTSGKPWVEILDATSLEVERRLEDPESRAIWSADWLPGGELIAAAGDGARVVLLRAADGAAEETWSPGGVWSREPATAIRLAVHPSGDIVVTGHTDGTLVCWERNAGGPVASFREAGQTIDALAFHPDGCLLAVGARHLVQIWEVAPFRRIVSLHGHVMDVHSLAYSPAGDTLISSSHDGTLRLWETR